MVRDILVSHLFINGADKAIEVGMQAVGIGKPFEMEPEALNQIEERTVLGQPDQENAVLQSSNRRLNSFAFVIRGIVEDQHEALVGIDGEGEMFKKSDKGFAVLSAILSPGDVSGAPVVGSKDMGVKGRTGRGNALTLPALGPATAQRWMQT